MIGWTDLPADLSDQAQIDRLSAYLPKAAPVVSSDLLRARQTADALQAGRVRLPHQAALREMHFGAWENRRYDDIAQTDPVLAAKFWQEPGDIAPPGGESWHMLSDRVAQAAQALIGTAPHIIVVAHFGAILSQVQRARGITIQESFAQPIDNLSLTRIEFTGTEWQLHEVNHSV